MVREGSGSGVAHVVPIGISLYLWAWVLAVGVRVLGGVIVAPCGKTGTGKGLSEGLQVLICRGCGGELFSAVC